MSEGEDYDDDGDDDMDEGLDDVLRRDSDRAKRYRKRKTKDDDENNKKAVRYCGITLERQTLQKLFAKARDKLLDNWALKLVYRPICYECNGVSTVIITIQTKKANVDIQPGCVQRKSHCRKDNRFFTRICVDSTWPPAMCDDGRMAVYDMVSGRAWELYDLRQRVDLLLSDNLSAHIRMFDQMNDNLHYDFNVDAGSLFTIDVIPMEDQSQE